MKASDLKTISRCVMQERMKSEAEAQVSFVLKILKHEALKGKVSAKILSKLIGSAAKDHLLMLGYELYEFSYVETKKPYFLIQW